MLKMAVNVAVFGAFLLMTLIFGFFLWQTLFTPEKHGGREIQSKPAYSEQHGGNENAFSASPAPSMSKASTDEAIAEYTRWLAIFTMFLVLATLGLFVSGERNVEVARKSAEAAKESAEIASKTLIATQRPWINSEIKIASDLIFGETEARITFAYTLKNVGNAVATNIQVNPRLIPFQFGKVSGEPPNIQIEIPQTRPIAELKTLCENQARLLDNPNAAEFVGGHVIFPNDSIPDAVNIHILNADISVARAQSAYKSLIPVLLFCVAYRSPFDKGTHYTGHAFQLFRRDSKSAGGAREINPEEGNVPANELTLMRLPFNSSIAN
jgi:hypothetical protein